MAITDPIDACRFWLHDDVAPYTFSVPQIEEFLDLEQVMDEDGRLPDNVNWEPTYDVLRAAGRGWLWLAGTMGNKAISYKIGDVSITIDKGYCRDRAADLMAAASGTVLRRDERHIDKLARYRKSP